MKWANNEYFEGVEFYLDEIEDLTKTIFDRKQCNCDWMDIRLVSNWKHESCDDCYKLYTYANLANTLGAYPKCIVGRYSNSKLVTIVIFHHYPPSQSGAIFYGSMDNYLQYEHYKDEVEFADFLKLKGN